MNAMFMRVRDRANEYRSSCPVLRPTGIGTGRARRMPALHLRSQLSSGVGQRSRASRRHAGSPAAIGRRTTRRSGNLPLLAARADRALAHGACSARDRLALEAQAESNRYHGVQAQIISPSRNSLFRGTLQRWQINGPKGSALRSASDTKTPTSALSVKAGDGTSRSPQHARYGCSGKGQSPVEHATRIGPAGDRSTCWFFFFFFFSEQSREARC